MSDTPPRVMKAHETRGLGTRVAFNYEDLRERAAAHLSEAKAEAAALVEQARREADAIRTQARTEGLNAGKKEGLQDGQRTVQQQAEKLAQQRLSDQVRTVVPSLQQAAELLKDERDRWLVRWERAAIDLAVAIAGKLLRSTLDAQPERAEAMVREALQLAAGQPQIRVFLNAQDLQQLGTQAATIVQSLTSCATAEIIAEPALTPGSCRIETRHGEIDARLETMLTRITEELLAT